MTRTLVIPMLNETGRIGATLETLAGSPLCTAELILVDDGSTDGTPEMARAAMAAHGLQGQVLELERNMGKGAAVRAGVAIASGEAIAFCDADLSTPTGDIVTCFELIESGTADMVVATRLADESIIVVTQNIFRRWTGKVFNILLRTLGLTTRADTQCGLKAFNEKTASIVFRELRINRFAFDVELLVRAERAGLRVAEVPVLWSHNDQSSVRPVRDGLRMALDVFRLRMYLRSTPPDNLEGAPVAMDDERFAAMARVERDHWWFRAKRELVMAFVARAGETDASRARGAGRALDIGCGTGELLNTLAGVGYPTVVGTDASPTALHFAKDALHLADASSGPSGSSGSSGSSGCLAGALAEQLPFADASFALVTSLDVIEHLDNDVVALREYHRVTQPGGTVVVAVPAYQWAWSDHDVALGHRRRYTARALVDATTRAGLEVDHVTYFHAWLVPLAFLVRRTPLGRLQRAGAEEASFVNPTVNRWLAGLTEFERRLAVRIGMPFGLSVMVVAHRPSAARTLTPTIT